MSEDLKYNVNQLEKKLSLLKGLLSEDNPKNGQVIKNFTLEIKTLSADLRRLSVSQYTKPRKQKEVPQPVVEPTPPPAVEKKQRGRKKKEVQKPADGLLLSDSE